MYSAFTQIRNLQRHEEVKYIDYESPSDLLFTTTTPSHLIPFTTSVSQGIGPGEMIGRRIKVTSITMNCTFRVSSSVAYSDVPAIRIMAFTWKEGQPPNPITDAFTSTNSLTQVYWADEFRYRKRVFLDRKFSPNLDRPVFQRTFRFKVPPRIVTTPGDYNDIFFLILTDSQATAGDYLAMSYSSRVSFKDS